MTTRLLRRAGLTMAVLAASLAIAGPVSAAPSGNNGTVKIDGSPWDNLPNNEPHVGCVFQVDFYGFDANQPVEVSFEAQAPSGDKDLGTISGTLDGDDNSGGGSLAGYDGSLWYSIDVTGLTEHPQQGYHVKMTVHAPGMKGADTKHKVFWVTGCDPCPTDDPPTEPPNQTET
jgi:hypothetical protein